MLALYGTIGRTILSLFFRVEKRRCPRGIIHCCRAQSLHGRCVITLRALPAARCAPAGREVEVVQFTLKCILIAYYQCVLDGHKEDIQVE